VSLSGTFCILSTGILYRANTPPKGLRGDLKCVVSVVAELCIETDNRVLFGCIKSAFHVHSFNAFILIS